MKEVIDVAGSGRYVTLERTDPKARLSGYVLSVSDQLALVHPFRDFMPDGYSVVRVADVVEVRDTDRERHWHRMLHGEALLGGLGLGFRPDLTSIPAAIESIRRQYHHMIVRCKDDEEPIEDFYIGHPLAIGSGGVIFRHFDALGQWEDEPAVINVPEISIVEFDTPYIVHLEKYLGDGRSGMS